MSDIGDIWTGPDWEKYCRRLLALRYGVGYQPVPDRDRGDFGIDGFTSGGEVFQCYAAQDPRSLDELHKKQRSKITTDLKKLEKNIGAVRALTAPANIKCWVLLVPRCDTKRTVEHGAAKAAELREKRLGGIDNEFYVRVLTDEDFDLEKQELASIGTALLPVPPSHATGESTEAWKADRPEAVDVLSRKVAHLPGIGSDDEQRELCEELIRFHLNRGFEEDRLRGAQPQMWERLNSAKNQREEVLDAERIAAAPDERRTLLGEVSEVRERLESAVPALVGGLAERLAWGIVADWLIRCPLKPVPPTVV